MLEVICGWLCGRWAYGCFLADVVTAWDVLKAWGPGAEVGDVELHVGDDHAHAWGQASDVEGLRNAADCHGYVDIRVV